MNRTLRLRAHRLEMVLSSRRALEHRTLRQVIDKVSSERSGAIHLVRIGRPFTLGLVQSAKVGQTFRLSIHPPKQVAAIQNSQAVLPVTHPKQAERGRVNVRNPFWKNDRSPGMFDLAARTALKSVHYIPGLTTHWVCFVVAHGRAQAQRIQTRNNNNRAGKSECVSDPAWRMTF